MKLILINYKKSNIIYKWQGKKQIKGRIIVEEKEKN